MINKSSFLFEILALFHYSVYRFEHFFSQTPWIILKGRTAQEDFMYWFDVALNTRFTFPEKSSNIFNELLERLQHVDYPKEWAIGRKGRIYYYLGTLIEEPSAKASFYRQCLALMPNHYMARELLFEITGEKDS